LGNLRLINKEKFDPLLRGFSCIGARARAPRLGVRGFASFIRRRERDQSNFRATVRILWPHDNPSGAADVGARRWTKGDTGVASPSAKELAARAVGACAKDYSITRVDKATRKQCAWLDTN
jgi:hypothetical protein